MWTSMALGRASRLCLLLLASVSVISLQALDNGLARTPPMGWNSWYCFGWSAQMTETAMKQVADALVTSGMRDAGYIYLCIDDCWSTGRDGSGNLIADPSKFPSGMKSLVDYVHAQGLKFGIYTDAGTRACSCNPSGSKGYEQKDAALFASWGVDLIKDDWCNTTGQNTVSSYLLMRNGITNSGRAMVLSICEWGVSQPWTWGAPVGHLWRTTLDIQDTWTAIMQNVDTNGPLFSYAGPGHWNDPDIMQVGLGGMSTTEYRTHFSMWSIMASPLIAGNNVRSMSQAIKDILLAPEVIAVDQDSLGIQGSKVKAANNLEVWSKKLRDSTRAVVLLNRSAAAANITVNWSDLGLPSGNTYQVRDLWARLALGAFTGSYTASSVPSHGVSMIKVGTPVSRIEVTKQKAVVSQDYIYIYPNPITREIRIKTDRKNSAVVLYSLSGRIMEKVKTSDGQMVVLDKRGNLKNGVYLVGMEGHNNLQRVMLIK